MLNLPASVVLFLCCLCLLKPSMTSWIRHSSFWIWARCIPADSVCQREMLELRQHRWKTKTKSLRGCRIHSCSILSTMTIFGLPQHHFQAKPLLGHSLSTWTVKGFQPPLTLRPWGGDQARMWRTKAAKDIWAMQLILLLPQLNTCLFLGNYEGVLK